MEELTDGCSVRIQGLVSATQHNGKKGVLICFDERTGRWGVEVGDAELLAVKPASLVFVREPVEIDDSERQRPADIPTSDCPRATREQIDYITGRSDTARRSLHVVSRLYSK